MSLRLQRPRRGGRWGWVVCGVSVLGASGLWGVYGVAEFLIMYDKHTHHMALPNHPPMEPTQPLNLPQTNTKKPATTSHATFRICPLKAFAEAVPWIAWAFFSPFCTCRYMAENGRKPMAAELSPHIVHA